MTRLKADEKALSIVGTKRWSQTVPLHLQRPLAKALNYMDANDLPNALQWFGISMDACQNFHEAKPVFFFGAQVAGQRFLELRGENPNHPDLPEWRKIASDILNADVELFPDDPVARHNLGRFLQDAGDPEGAKAAYRHTLMLDSTQVETWANLADLLYQSGDRTTAYECWERAVALPAEKASARLSQAYFWLRNGDYIKGWQAFNDRWHDLVFQRGYGRQKELGGIHWHGEKLPKRHALFLHGEQGLGDHVQFARYAPVLQNRGIRVVGLETRPILKRWMAASYPELPIYSRSEDSLPSFTHHCSTMDLPGILGTTLETVPPPIAPGDSSIGRAPGCGSGDWGSTPHHLTEGLQIDGETAPRSLSNSFGKSQSAVVDRYRDRRREEALTRPLKVGIAWEGAKGNTADAIRSIPAEELRHLADIPGVTWVSLQFAPDAAMVGRSWLGKAFVDGTEGCTDALDTAAVMRGLDLVITVDTATLHLAGTLGIPTWGLHRFVREWRYLDSGEECAWYPSVKNYTQTTPNGWPELLQRVRADLMHRACQPSDSPPSP